METLLAYFDPGSGSLLVQLIAGGSAGLIVLTRYLWESSLSTIRRRNDCDESSPTSSARHAVNARSSPAVTRI